MKVLLLTIGICICFLLFYMIQIYAKYLSTASGNTKLTIANWNIIVNNLSIKNNTNISNSIVPVFPGTDHIASNIIAPTAEGYFDLNFDFSNTDVSFEYTIEISPDKNSSVQDLVTTGYSINDGEKIVFENYNQTISEIIELSNNIKTRKIRVYIMWDDNENSQTMTNEDDTISTNSESSPLLNVNISFTQITNVSENTPINP